MAFSTRPLDDGRGSLVVGVGEVTEEEVLEAYRGYFQPDHVRRRLYVLADFTRITAITARSQIAAELARMGQATAEHNPRDGVVAVVGASDLAFGMARMWEAHVDERLTSIGWSTRATRDLDEAVRWIAEAMRARHGLEVEDALRVELATLPAP